MGTMRQAPGTLPRGRALVLSTATTVTVVAWGVLVFAAIDFGRSARSGAALNWLWLALATVGGIGCMFAALVLASRMQNMIRLSARSSTRPLPRSLQASADDSADDSAETTERPASGHSGNGHRAQPHGTNGHESTFAEVPGRPAAARVRGGSAGKRAVRR